MHAGEMAPLEHCHHLIAKCKHGCNTVKLWNTFSLLTILMMMIKEIHTFQCGGCANRQFNEKPPKPRKAW